MQGQQRRMGWRIIGLEDELDVELGGRIIDPRQRLEQLRHDIRLVVERNDDRVMGQLGVGQGRRFGLACAPAGRAGQHAHENGPGQEYRDRQAERQPGDASRDGASQRRKPKRGQYEPGRW